MGKTMKKLWDVLSTIIVAFVVILAVLLVGVRLVGMKVYTVLSGSMEPTFHTGSLIYVKSVDYTQLKEGDPITFMLDEKTIATHRIVAVIPDEEDASVIRYQTKGDANDAVDGGLVHYKNVIGMPVFTIPYLGFVANYIQNPPGLYISIAFGVVLLLLVFLPDLIGDEEGEKEKSNKTNGKAKHDNSPAKASKHTKPAKTDDAMVETDSEELSDVENEKNTPAEELHNDESEKRELSEMDLLNAELEEILGKKI